MPIMFTSLQEKILAIVYGLCTIHWHPKLRFFIVKIIWSSLCFVNDCHAIFVIMTPKENQNCIFYAYVTNCWKPCTFIAEAQSESTIQKKPFHSSRKRLFWHAHKFDPTKVFLAYFWPHPSFILSRYINVMVWYFLWLVACELEVHGMFRPYILLKSRRYKIAFPRPKGLQ